MSKRIVAERAETKLFSQASGLRVSGDGSFQRRPQGSVYAERRF
jgi:hypothetical protein